MIRAAIVCGLLLAFQAGTRPPFDMVILNGHVIDGTGSPWYAADIGIRGGRIVAIGRLADAPARQTIDARGRVVAPGFIDMLGQSELTVLVDPHLPSKVFQGITTEVTGEGGSVAPLNDAIIKADKVDYDHFKLTPDWRTFAQYFTRVEKQGLGIKDHAFTYVAVFGMSEPDVALAVSQPWVSFNNDSQGTAPTGLLGQEHPHPRAYGTFPRVLRKYVREDKLLSLEEAIRKMSALPGQKMGFADRGVLKAGMWADIAVFDPDTITDVATFAQPNQLSVGMDYVLVNGVPVITAGKATNALPGKILRGPGAK